MAEIRVIADKVLAGQSVIYCDECRAAMYRTVVTNRQGLKFSWWLSLSSDHNRGALLRLMRIRIMARKAN